MTTTRLPISNLLLSIVVSSFSIYFTTLVTHTNAEDYVTLAHKYIELDAKYVALYKEHTKLLVSSNKAVAGYNACMISRDVVNKHIGK